MHTESVRFWKFFYTNFEVNKQIFTKLLILGNASLYVYLYLPRYLLSISPSQWPEGVGGNGRDHYITKHPQATVLSNCHTRLPIHCLHASGQVLCDTLQMHGGWKEKVEGWNERKDGKEEGEWDKREGGIATKHHVAGPSLSPGPKLRLFSLDTQHLCLYDPDNVRFAEGQRSGQYSGCCTG